ncbi:PepSY-like domain-containing protein [Flavobacterium sp.]|uniref:PepSY-like domain-containing protein n=1 Tax=Flavobacterium sp. TaxID=239 RepID=UPI0025D016AC|nr:PepSY-like domain-containing protein [Flavobacterium sp.]
MKKNAILLVVLMLAALSYGQKTDVPLDVKNAFERQYPTIKKVKWEKEKDNYEAGYVVDKVRHSVLMDAKGKIIETETGIQISQLPANVREYVIKHYKGQKIKEAAEIRDAGQKLTFEAEVKGMDLIFDNKGNFIKETKD